MIHNCTCGEWDDISSLIEACIEDIGIWMNSNMLKLNRDKTKFSFLIEATCEEN